MARRQMCTYCAHWYDIEHLTPLYEQDKPNIAYYCDRCISDVKYNIGKLPYRSLFTWGKKGESK